MSSPAPWPALRVTYRVTASNQSDLNARVESLLLEQTVELPRVALRDPSRPICELSICSLPHAASDGMIAMTTAGAWR